MNKTGIEYLDYTWNPIAMRCTPVSEGCANCWHLRMANRLASNPIFSAGVREAYAGEGPPVLVYSRWKEPQEIKTPSVIGVQFMGDLWHPNVDYEDVLDVLIEAGVAKQHTFLVLTKRPERMKDWVNNFVNRADFPPNVWVGVTAENQKKADERIPILLEMPATIRFVSIEPMLGPIKLAPHNGLDWVIVGGESGPNARPTHPQWVIGIRDQCQENNVPFFFKQWGAWIKSRAVPSDDWSRVTFMDTDGEIHKPTNGLEFWRVGKKRAGRRLGGKEYNEMPRNG